MDNMGSIPNLLSGRAGELIVQVAKRAPASSKTTCPSTTDAKRPVHPSLEFSPKPVEPSKPSVTYLIQEKAGHGAIAKLLKESGPVTVVLTQLAKK